MRMHPLTLLPLPTFLHFIIRVVADTSDFEEDGLVFFELPEDDITELKTYTATYKFRLGDGWESGNIVPFTLYNDVEGYSLVNVIVR